MADTLGNPEPMIGALRSDFVQLYWKLNRGWPSPEKSWGLGPMFGDDGWCRRCGTALRAQCGPITLRRSGLSPLAGAWVPNWRYDALCMAGSLAERLLAEGFAVELRGVEWKGVTPGPASQIVAPTTTSPWFDVGELKARAVDRHGVAGATCKECGTWRWMPMTFGLLPAVNPDALISDADVIASPEWFGDGCQSFRQILVRRELAAFIARASPRDFQVREV